VSFKYLSLYILNFHQETHSLEFERDYFSRDFKNFKMFIYM